ncbi:MAG: hypothetical protein ACJA0N_000189 [Pseudohongiellaceae bacterium]|jgi:hypothetical protein
MDPDLEQIKLAKEIGSDRINFTPALTLKPVKRMRILKPYFSNFIKQQNWQKI